MGLRGRKLESSHILKLRGSPRGKGRVDGPVGVIADEPPIKLTGRARAEWDRLLPLLRDAGIVGETDAGCLADYCQVTAEVAELDRLIAEQGETLTTTRGGVRLNPLVRVRTDAWRRKEKLMTALGLTPMSRQSIKRLPTPSDHDSANDRLFSRGI